MTAKLEDIKDCPDWPRWLSAEQAAAFVGVSVNVFQAEVDAGIWPKPIRRGKARNTWDRKLLDRASDIESGIVSASTKEAEREALSRLGG